MFYNCLFLLSVKEIYKMLSFQALRTCVQGLYDGEDTDPRRAIVDISTGIYEFILSYQQLEGPDRAIFLRTNRENCLTVVQYLAGLAPFVDIGIGYIYYELTANGHQWVPLEVLQIRSGLAFLVTYFSDLPVLDSDEIFEQINRLQLNPDDNNNSLNNLQEPVYLRDHMVGLQGELVWLDERIRTWKEEHHICIPRPQHVPETHWWWE